MSTLNIPLTICICLASFASSFSSLSVIFQLYAASHNIQVNILKLIIFKVINGILSALISYCLITITPFSRYIHNAKNVFLNSESLNRFTNNSIHSYAFITFCASILYIFLICFILLLIQKVANNSHLNKGG